MKSVIYFHHKNLIRSNICTVKLSCMLICGAGERLGINTWLQDLLFAAFWLRAARAAPRASAILPLPLPVCTQRRTDGRDGTKSVFLVCFFLFGISLTGRTAFCVVALPQRCWRTSKGKKRLNSRVLNIPWKPIRKRPGIIIIISLSAVIHFYFAPFFWGGAGGGWLFFPFSFFQVGLTEEFQHKINVPLKLNGQEGS